MPLDLIALDLIRYFKMSLREIERFSLMLKIAIDLDKLVDRDNAEAHCHNFIVMSIGALLIALKLCDGTRSISCIDMNEEELFIEYFKRIFDNEFYKDIIKAPYEQWPDTSSYMQGSDFYITFTEKTKQIYQLIFAEHGLENSMELRLLN